MDREVALVVLVLLVCGPILQVFGLVPNDSIRDLSGRKFERKSWARLWGPTLPALLAFCVFLGWALAEPDESDERFFPIVFLAVAPYVLIVARAGARALRALLTEDEGVARTAGLFRPRTVIAPELVDALDAEAIVAVCEHEQAHVRHRDPLRIWLAQLASDLQWPCPAARGRFRTWLEALEIARDEETRARGVDGVDLAAAVIEAARFQTRRTVAVGANLTGEAEALDERIARLLAPLPSHEPTHNPRVTGVVLIATLAAAVGLGIRYGDAIVRSLPGVDTSSLSESHSASQEVPPFSGYTRLSSRPASVQREHNSQS